VRGDVTVWNTLQAHSLTLNRVPQWKMVREDTFDKFVPMPKRPLPSPSLAKPSVINPTDLKRYPSAPPTVSIPTSAAVGVAATTASAAGGVATAASSTTAPAPPPPSAVDAAARRTALDEATASASEANLALAKKARGWWYDDVIRCNGFAMLSAKPGRTISTTYMGLPKHTHIRVTATVHFIDDWQGETGWLKLNDRFVWTESHDQRNTAGKFSMCGSDLYPESRFAAPIDIIWKHNEPSLTLALGSNLDEGSDARFAVSNIAIHTRDASRRKKKKKGHKHKHCKKKSADGKTCLDPKRKKGDDKDKNKK